MHDSTGFADCGLTVIGSDIPITRGVLINPTITQDPRFLGKLARPVEWKKWWRWG